METLEVHTLICKRDVQWWIATVNLFKHYSGLDFRTVVHEDGTLDEEDWVRLTQAITPCKIWRRAEADAVMVDKLKDYPCCSHFRFSAHHTVFKIKLFDPFLLSESHNVIQMDADILFCKTPTALLENISQKIGCYFRDTWSSYCVPFRPEDEREDAIWVHRPVPPVIHNINAGMSYVPTTNHYSLPDIERGLEILYDHGSKGATHPFLEQSGLAFMITKRIEAGIAFRELPHPDYCIPTFGQFIAEHGCTALHLNSSGLVGSYKKDHYNYELAKIGLPPIIV
jgi:hypothetical protein